MAQFFQAPFQPLPAAAQRLENGFGAGRQTALQASQGKAHAAAVPGLQLIRLAHFFPYVAGHGLVKRLFRFREAIVQGVGTALGEQTRVVEFEKVFLDHTAHDVGDIDLCCRAFAEFAVKALGIEQGEKKLKILFLAVVRRGGHQQKVPGLPAQELAELEAPGFVDFIAEKRG